MADSKLLDPSTANSATVLPQKLRHLPVGNADLMILSSYGDIYPKNVSVARKIVPPEATDELQLARDELDYILDFEKQNETVHLVNCYTENCSVQFSKKYYLQRIRKLLLESKKQLGTAMLFINY